METQLILFEDYNVLMTKNTACTIEIVAFITSSTGSKICHDVHFLTPTILFLAHDSSHKTLMKVACNAFLENSTYTVYTY